MKVPTSFVFYVVASSPSRVLIRVFAGPDEEHRRLCGLFELDRGEWADLKDVLVAYGGSAAELEVKERPDVASEV